MEVRDRIRAVLDEKKLSEREVSMAAGLSDSMLNKFLAGKTQSITVDNLEKVAQALGVSFRFLMFGDEEDEKLHYIWDYIPDRRKAQALAVLETFADDKLGGAA